MNVGEKIQELLFVAAGNGIELKEIVICFVFSFLFSMFIYFAYKLAIRNEFYSQDFNISLIIIVFITSSLVLTAQSNLITALGIAGALSIIKFRTAVKSPLDLTFMFWAASTGIICGAQYYKLAVLLSIVIFLILLILKRINFPSNLCLLVIYTSSLDDSNLVIDELKGATTFLRLKNKTINNDGVELILEYKTKDQATLESLLSKNKTVDSFSIINYDRETRI